MPMPHHRLSPVWGIGVLVAAWAVAAGAQAPGAEEIRQRKIAYLEECCYNASGVTEEAIAAIPTDKLLQYPALRKTAEAQVPRLNQMFAGRYLGSVVALDDFKPRILYFVKGLTAADRVRVKADPALLNVQLADTAYSQRDIAGLTQQLQKEQRWQDVSPQLKAAFMERYQVQFPSLQSVNALPDAVFIQHTPVDADALHEAVSKLFGEQLVSVAMNNDVLGHATLDALVHQPQPAQLQRLRGDAKLRDVQVVPYPMSKAEIERIQDRIVRVLNGSPTGNGQHGFVGLSFNYELRKFYVGVNPGQVDRATEILRRYPDIPANCCDVQEQLAVELSNPVVTQ